MTAQKHTEGPWVFEDYSQEETEFFVIPATYHGTVAKVFREEDARLIAASPDLLAMLKVAQLWLDVDGRFDMQGINAAIAKAEGQSNA